MCGWDDHIVKYFLLGNPIVYWGSTLSIGVFFLMLGWYSIRWQRGYKELSAEQIDRFHYAGIYPVIGWFLHYLPFIAMARVTYVHHYYPALYFAILCAGFCVDWYTRDLKKILQAGIFSVLYVAVIGLFVMFRAISFGMEGNNQQWKHLKWLPTWRMVD
ncbi:Dolichyl-phosphate-mannose--protein mannosyltransferase 2 [Oleoguttula sp. CCFEE 5521]